VLSPLAFGVVFVVVPLLKQQYLKMCQTPCENEYKDRDWHSQNPALVQSLIFLGYVHA